MTKNYEEIDRARQTHVLRTKYKEESAVVVKVEIKT